jgi:hypothetical protein
VPAGIGRTAQLHQRTGWTELPTRHKQKEAQLVYDKAIELAGNTAETAYQTRRREQLR